MLNSRIMPEYLPIQYRMEIYEDTFYNDPTEVFHSSTPFLAVNAGDYIAHRGWSVPPNSDMEGKVLRVKAIQQIIYTIEKSHVGHSLSVCVEAVPKPDGIF